MIQYRIALMMKAVSTSENSASSYQTTRHSIPEDNHRKLWDEKGPQGFRCKVWMKVSMDGREILTRILNK
jgi:hypothetical protein